MTKNIKNIKHVSRRDLLRAIDEQAERISALEEISNGYLLLLHAIAEEVDGPIIFTNAQLEAVDSTRALHLRRTTDDEVWIELDPSPPSAPVPVVEEPTDAPHDAGLGIADDPPFTVARDPGDEHRDEPIVYVGGDGSRVRPLL